MNYYVMYNLQNGVILARLKFANPEQADPYDNLLEVSEEEFASSPEVHKQVNLDTLTLEDKSEG